MKKMLIIILTLFILSSCSYTEDVNDTPAQNELESHEKDNEYWSWFIYPGEYENIKLYDENFIGVQNESGKYGFINKEKELIVDYEYSNIIGISEGIARVLDFDNNYIYIDNQGNIISKIKFPEAEDFNEGLAAVKNRDDKWGFINTKGEVIIGYQFDGILEGFKEGVAAVEVNDSWSFIFKDGTSAFFDQYDEVTIFSEGYAGVKKNGKWGFINKKGELVIDYEYDDVGNFSEDKAAVMLISEKGEEWGYINSNNEIIINFRQYDASEGRLLNIGEFMNGYALVTDTLYCLIDAEGKTVLGDDSYLLSGGATYNPEHNLIAAYDYVDEFMLNKKYGFINIDGAIVIPFVFEHVSDIYDDLAFVLYNDNDLICVGVIKISHLLQ